MRPFVVRPISHLEGKVTLPGDKSIAHRSIIISSLSRSPTKIENFPTNQDCLSTQRAFQKLGIKITQEHPTTCKEPFTAIAVKGKGLLGLVKPKGAISVGDSGTTFRLLLGVLAGQDFETRLIAGESLSRRPMLRVTAPLRMMGARIRSASHVTRHTFQALRSRLQAPGSIEEYPPIIINGGSLKGITYRIPVASAQVKGALLLAGLFAQGRTKLIEPVETRDHTERMLELFKADIKVERNSIVIKGNKELVSPKKIYIPGDISSAAFFVVAAALIPDSHVVIKNVSLNPSRIGIIKVLKRMGADIKVQSTEYRVQSTEPMGNIIAKSSRLRSTRVTREEIPSLIDELPILMVAAACAKGRTVFEGVGELRVKETDRIRSMLENLRKMGSNIEVPKDERSEKIIIRGVKQLKAARVRSFGDHRTAMSMVVAALTAVGNTQIDDISCINKSFPNFISLLKSLIK
jgi:3-phosphoshikimate 1-carboxyvinyltransferase